MAEDPYYDVDEIFDPGVVAVDRSSSVDDAAADAADVAAAAVAAATVFVNDAMLLVYISPPFCRHRSEAIPTELQNSLYCCRNVPQPVPSSRLRLLLLLLPEEISNAHNHDHASAFVEGWYDVSELGWNSSRVWNHRCECILHRPRHHHYCPSNNHDDRGGD